MINIGFMQGRLSPIIDGKIQSFPWHNWENELVIANNNDFNTLEWTLDQDRLYENPLMNIDGREEIKKIIKQNNILIPSITGDCFMQEPFYKKNGNELATLLTDFKNILISCVDLNINKILIPLVDNGKIENSNQANLLYDSLYLYNKYFKANNIKIIFESDFEPIALKYFIDKFDKDCYGINYDTGNSASLGYNILEEFNAYGNRIYNIHIKDRILNGKSVPLGDGNTNFDCFKIAIRKINYQGNYILQTARDINKNHLEILLKSRKFILNYIESGN